MVDYSLYLVTDSTMIPESSTFIDQVKESIKNGATIVQLREKSILTLDFIERAKEVHELTKRANIPLIINDRLDVALAIDAEGVHVGQDDMPATIVRQILGPNKIIGVTCSDPEEVEGVIKDGVADYVGLGTVYQTNTKSDTKYPDGCGPIGIRKMLKVLYDYNKSNKKQIKSVAIGGINHSNAAKVLYQCKFKDEELDGVAVVSCIMANINAGKATQELLEIIKSTSPWSRDLVQVSQKSSLESKITTLKDNKPLIHHITNNVVKNFSANICLAIGASPIMSELAEEYEEFTSKISNLALVLNLGTPSPELMDVFKAGIAAYNKYGRHIVFDPVAAGASQARLNCCRRLLNYGQFSVIKGNVGEILAIWKLTSTYSALGSEETLMRGVDSIASLSEEVIIKIGTEVSKDFNCTVVITGATNYVIDQKRTSKIKGGHELMATVVGTGCSLGSVIAAFVASKADGMSSKKFDIFEATCGAVTLYNKCGELASKNASAPGEFMTQFIDELYKNTH